MQIGFKPLPISLKALFILLFLGVGIALVSLFLILISLLFGEISITQQTQLIVNTLLLSSLSLITGGIFIYALYKRKSWTFIYGITYFTFFILLGIISLIYTEEVLTQILGILINTLFLIVLIAKKAYFQKPVISK